MALPITSGTAAFLVTRDDVIKSSLQNLKVLIAGQTPGATDLTDCALRLNMILKAMNMKGYLEWLYQTIVIPMVASQATYTIAESGSPSFTNSRPVRVAAAWRRYNTTTPPQDIPLILTSRSGYDLLTPKTIIGIPNTLYYDPQIGLSNFVLWPVPSDATNSTVLCIQRPIQDITSGTQNFDVTQEWFLPLVWMLSDEISMMYQVSPADRKEASARAAYWREEVANFTQEDASVTFVPDQQVGNDTSFP